MSPERVQIRPLEQAARRAEARDTTSPTAGRLRQGTDLVQRFSRGRWPTGGSVDRDEATPKVSRRAQHGE